jgi:hypothetical protein
MIIYRSAGITARRKPQKIALMNINEGNYLRDAVRYYAYLNPDRHDRYARVSNRFKPELDYRALLDNSIGRHSYLANLGLVGVRKTCEGNDHAISRAAGGRPAHTDFHYELRFADGAIVPFNVQNAEQSEVRYADRLWRGDVQLSAFDEALERFGALGRERHFQPIVSYAPSAYTAYADFVAFDDHALSNLSLGLAAGSAVICPPRPQNSASFSST